MKKQSGLVTFTQRECAEYDYYYNICLKTDKPCLIKDGKVCSYFERILLSIAKQQGIYDRVYNQYSNIRKGLKKEKVRVCPDCGIELEYRQRLCVKCARKRRQIANRNNQRKSRKIRMS